MASQTSRPAAPSPESLREPTWARFPRGIARGADGTPPFRESLITQYQLSAECPQVVTLWAESVDAADPAASGFVATIHRRGVRAPGKGDGRPGLIRVSVAKAYLFIDRLHEHAEDFALRFTELHGTGPNQGRAEVFVDDRGCVFAICNSAAAARGIKANGLSRREREPVTPETDDFLEQIDGIAEAVAYVVVAPADGDEL